MEEEEEEGEEEEGEEEERVSPPASYSALLETKVPAEDSDPQLKI